MTAFIPKHFPRHRLPSGRVLTDSQQHQYDVLRTVGGKLVSNRLGWFRILSDTHREKITGLNITAMFKLVQMGLVVCGSDRPYSNGFLFMLPEIAKDVPGPRYERQGQIDTELPAAPKTSAARKHADPPGTLRITDVDDMRVITLTGVHKENS